MPHVDEDLEEGLKLRATGAGLVLNRTFFCYTLEGSNPVNIFTSALSLVHPSIPGSIAHTGADIPTERQEIIVPYLGVNRKLECTDLDLEPWPSHDAIVRATYTENTAVAGFGPIVIETGADLEQSETDFDADNLLLPFEDRTPIFVDPPSAFSGADRQYPRCPILMPKPSIVLTREQTVDPEDLADEYVGWKNANIFRGRYGVGTILCMSIRGRNNGDGKWITTYQFARDKNGKFNQVVRWQDPLGRFPNLEPADFAASAGIKEVVVQGSKSYAGLQLG